MALRQLLGGGASLREYMRFFSAVAERTAPTVYDKMVQLTIIDGSGRRFPVRGLEGQTVSEVLEADEGPLDVSDFMCLSPEGRGQPECVVTVPNEFTTRIPPPGIDEFRQLEQICEHSITSNTRLGSQIVLSKDLNNMLIALSAVLPTHTL